MFKDKMGNNLNVGDKIAYATKSGKKVGISEYIIGRLFFDPDKVEAFGQGNRKTFGPWGWKKKPYIFRRILTPCQLEAKSIKINQ